MECKKIVIIGGGFAGLTLARKLARTNCHIVLVDKQNHHMFQPLFYQVASARLEPSSISFPFRAVFRRKKNVEFRYAAVKQIHPERKVITTTMGDLTYDMLVIASGCRTNYFGNANLAKYTLAMKTTQHTIHIRNTILSKFEKIIFVDEQEREELMNLVIVGGGPTGVELSGAFAEMKRNILPRDYPQFDFSKLRILLLEGSENTLNAMGEQSRKWSRKYLEQMGVEVRTSTVVEDYDGHALRLRGGEIIPTQTVIWAAGVKGNVIDGIDESVMVRFRYRVSRFSEILNYPDIYAIGDIAYMETPKYPQGHPQLANVAINQGKLLAKNIARKLEGKEQEPFEYKDKGTMATIGKHKAVVELPFMNLQGYFAWIIWMALHLMLILSVRNKIIVFYNWAWSYLTGDSSLRLILRDEKERDTIKSND
jgi:NADH:ubiquinone reductase (H+-translocating)